MEPTDMLSVEEVVRIALGEHENALGGMWIAHVPRSC